MIVEINKTNIRKLFMKNSMIRPIIVMEGSKAEVLMTYDSGLRTSAKYFEWGMGEPTFKLINLSKRSI